MRAAVVCLALICGARADLEPDMFNEEFEMPDMEELTTDSVQAHHHEPIRQELQGWFGGLIQGGASRDTCSVKGDPHIIPFEGNYFDIQRSPPVSSDNINDPGLVPFTIISSKVPGKWKVKIQVRAICAVLLSLRLPYTRRAVACRLPSSVAGLPTSRQTSQFP
jgi:hypothetical protein